MGATHGRGRGPSSPGAAPPHGRTGENTLRRWHTGRCGSGTGPGYRRPHTQWGPPACCTPQRPGRARCGGRRPPGEHRRSALSTLGPCRHFQARGPPSSPEVPSSLHPSVRLPTRSPTVCPSVLPCNCPPHRLAALPASPRHVDWPPPGAELCLALGTEPGLWTQPTPGLQDAPAHGGSTQEASQRRGRPSGSPSRARAHQGTLPPSPAAPRPHQPGLD